MPETPGWIKHFSILDKSRGKKKPPEATVPDTAISPSDSDQDPTVLLTEKKERAMQALMGEYSRLKQAAISARADNKLANALALLEQAEGFLNQAAELNRQSPDQLDTAKLDKILEQYPLPEKKKTPEIITPDTLSATTPEGKEISFNLREQIQYWSDFYEKSGVDWVSFPSKEEILSAITPDQITEMRRLMSLGFDKLIIIPDNLVPEPTITVDSAGKPTAVSNPRYEQLHQLMSQGYNPTSTGGDYDNDGKFQGSKDKTAKLRIILTKDVQNLKNDPLFKQTLNQSVNQLTDGLFTEKQVHGLSESEYLIYQKEYFKRIGKHLDEVGWTWLPESIRPLSGRVPSAGWYPGGSQLLFYSLTRGYQHGSLGCRLAGSFEIEI